MKTRTMKYMAFIITAVLLSGILTGCSEEKKALFGGGLKSDEVFSINGSVCTLPEAKLYLVNLQEQYESVYDSNMWDKKCGDLTVEEYVKKTVITQLARIKSMALFAGEYDMTLSEEEIATIQKAAGEYFASLNEDEIKCMGIEEQDVADAYSEYTLANKIYSFLTNETDTEVSDDEARVITIQQIIVNKFTTDDEGNRIPLEGEELQAAYVRAYTAFEKARSGEDFLTLADNYSENEVFELSIGRGKTEEEVEKVIFNMENDQVSDIIETEDGYYIMKCINSYDIDATDANKAVIIEQRKTKAFDEAYEVFVDGLTSHFNESLWKSVTFESSDNVGTTDFFDVYNRYFEG